MPELPEIETIRRALHKNIPGRKIVDLLVRDARLRWPVDEIRLRQLVVGQAVASVRRRAKYLLIHFKRESTLIIHLGMSGRLLLLAEARPFEKHDHVIFYFDDGTQLRFRDPRRFGMVDAIPPGALETYPRLAHLGVEPLAEDTLPEELFARAKNLKRPIKNLLMDATFMVGVGNIYANEALYYARIHPSTPANELALEAWQNLLAHVQTVLRNAINKGGTTLNDFVNSNGETGYFQLSLAVYGREGKPCPACGSEVERMVMVGRSTFFCPACQCVKSHQPSATRVAGRRERGVKPYL